MGYEDRPPVDPASLREHLRAWMAGEELPGRTLANLKTGRLDDLLADLGDQAAINADVIAAWESWERGKAEPAAVLTALVEGGLAGLLDSIAAA